MKIYMIIIMNVIINAHRKQKHMKKKRFVLILVKQNNLNIIIYAMMIVQIILIDYMKIEIYV